MKDLFPPTRKPRSGRQLSPGAHLDALLALAGCDCLSAQSPRAAAPRKKLLVIGEEKGYRHEAISHAMATIERLGRETGLWDTVIRTDTEPLTKKKLEYNAKNLNDFDAVLFYTGGTLEMDDQQKADFLSFIHDDGKGFIGVHSATITFTKWPEYGEMIGGYFDEHPWGTFDAPILVEDPAFPGMQQWPKAFTLKDEIYQMKNFSRDNTRVLMRLDPAQAGPGQSQGPPQGQRLRRHLGQDVRQGPRLLLHARPRRCQLGQAGDAEDVHRSHQVGAASGGRRRDAETGR